jgi:hypothetical protein
MANDPDVPTDPPEPGLVEIPEPPARVDLPEPVVEDPSERG